MISPLDSRYAKKVAAIEKCASDRRYYELRIGVEVSWLSYLAFRRPDLCPPMNDDERAEVQRMCDSMKTLDDEGYAHILEIEETTKHDVKAIEYYLGEKFPSLRRWIHLYLTSEDANSPARMMMLNDLVSVITEQYYDQIFCPNAKALIGKCAEISALTFTHFQAAVPSMLSRQMNALVYAIEEEIVTMKNAGHGLTCKFGGANGGLNALLFGKAVIASSSPIINHQDEERFLDNFVASRFGLHRSPCKSTSQIDNYRSTSEVLASVERLAHLLANLANNMRFYIFRGYFRQSVRVGEVGSSTMPSKVNPVALEQAQVSASLCGAMAHEVGRSLLYTTLQRDIGDSFMCRQFGEIFGNLALTILSVADGISRLEPDVDAIATDLAKHPEVFMEAVQTFLRIRGYNDAYEMCKAVSHGITGAESIYALIDKLVDVKEEDRHEIKRLLSENAYLGVR